MVDEARQPAVVRRVQHLGELPGEHGRRADVERLPASSPRRPALPASPRSASRSRSGGSGRGRRSRCPAAAGCRRWQCMNVLARKPALVRVVAHRVEDLGGDDHRSRGGPKSFSARPSISSLTPTEYMSAVSKKLIPSSSARRMNGRLSSSSSTQSRHFFEP